MILTQRAATLRDHAGQISFPGGRIEPEDADPWRAALREAHEEIGLAAEFVEFAGYLPDHLVVTGYRVTPVGRLRRSELRAEDRCAEVARGVRGAAGVRVSTRRTTCRELGASAMSAWTLYDIPYGERRIWGATAGMLMTFGASCASAGEPGAADDPRPLDELLAIMARLRGVDGCPWDREQTFATIAPYTIEEAYEVADAIERGDLAHLKDELGDLLFQVVFHAQIASEQGQFDFDAVAASICDKLVRRHPHVFAAAQRLTAAAQSAAWERSRPRSAAPRAGAAESATLTACRSPCRR